MGSYSILGEFLLFLCQILRDLQFGIQYIYILKIKLEILIVSTKLCIRKRKKEKKFHIYIITKLSFLYRNIYLYVVCHFFSSYYHHYHVTDKNYRKMFFLFQQRKEINIPDFCWFFFRKYIILHISHMSNELTYAIPVFAAIFVRWPYVSYI